MKTQTKTPNRIMSIIVGCILSALYLFVGLVVILVAQYFTDGLLENVLSLVVLVVALYAVYKQMRTAFRQR